MRNSKLSPSDRSFIRRSQCKSGQQQHSFCFSAHSLSWANRWAQAHSSRGTNLQYHLECERYSNTTKSSLCNVVPSVVRAVAPGRRVWRARSEEAKDSHERGRAGSAREFFLHRFVLVTCEKDSFTYTGYIPRYVLHVRSTQYGGYIAVSRGRCGDEVSCLCFCGPARDPVVFNDFFKLNCNTFRARLRSHPASNNPASPLAHEAHNVSMRGRPAPIGRASIRSNDGGSARISHTTCHSIHGAALTCG